MIFSLEKYKGVCEKNNIAIGVIFTAHRATRCGIFIFVQKNVCRFPVQTLRCDQHEARIYGVSNKKNFQLCVDFHYFPLY